MIGERSRDVPSVDDPGITNGSTRSLGPGTTRISGHYNAATDGKAIDKAALQKEAGLGVDETRRSSGVIASREQKGVAAPAVAPWLLEKEEARRPGTGERRTRRGGRSSPKEQGASLYP